MVTAYERVVLPSLAVVIWGQPAGENWLHLKQSVAWICRPPDDGSRFKAGQHQIIHIHGPLHLDWGIDNRRTRELRFVSCSHHQAADVVRGVPLRHRYIGRCVYIHTLCAHPPQISKSPSSSSSSPKPRNRHLPHARCLHTPVRIGNRICKVGAVPLPIQSDIRRADTRAQSYASSRISRRPCLRFLSTVAGAFRAWSGWA